MRLPNLSWVRSCGGFSFAWRPSSITSAGRRLAQLARPVLGPVGALAVQGLDQDPVGSKTL